MGLSEIKLPNDSNAGGYANKKFVQSMYLRNCGFALRAVPNGTVPSNPNEKITMLSNSQKGNGKRVFGNKTATPSAPLLRGRNTSGYATSLPLRPNPLRGLRIAAKPLAEIPHAALGVFKNKDNLNGVKWYYRGGEEDA